MWRHEHSPKRIAVRTAHRVGDAWGSAGAEYAEHVGTKKRLATFLVPVEKPVEEEASLKTKESEGTELRKSRNAQEMVEVGAGPRPTF